MHTRKDYMEGRCSYSDYYEGIARALGDAGFLRLPYSVPQIIAALERGDMHLNSLPLSGWDGAAIPFTRKAAVHRIFQAHDDWVSLGGFVCALKEWARMFARASINDEGRWRILHLNAAENAEKAAREAKCIANS